MICQFVNFMTVYELPVIPYTDYISEKYKDYGQNEAERYAEVVREIYSEAFNLPKYELGFKEKNELFAFLYKKSHKKQEKAD
jgi:hypothetical protein